MGIGEPAQPGNKQQETLNVKCNSCGIENPPGNHFCIQCGQPLPVGGQPAATPQAAVALPMGNTCPHCGKPVKPGARFCNACGKGIQVPAQPQPLPVVAPQGSAQALPVVNAPAQNVPINTPAPDGLATLRDPKLAALVATVFTCLLALACGLMLIVGCRGSRGRRCVYQHRAGV